MRGQTEASLGGRNESMKYVHDFAAISELVLYVSFLVLRFKPLLPLVPNYLRYLSPSSAHRCCHLSLFSLLSSLIVEISDQVKMQGGIQKLMSHGKNAVLQHIRLVNPVMRPLLFPRYESVAASSRMEEHGFESTTISDILKGKGKSADGSWLWCTTDDTVYEAVKSMTQHNVGALVVVKPGEQKSIAGIITERDYLRKIIVQGRSSKSTKVGDIMTEENKLITVKPDTKVLKAMQLMTDNRIRHIPVIDDKEMIGMVSIGDVVRAVVSEHRDELDRLNAYIHGGY
ncbi:CBS domain-containing protein CBSX3, mitochondrial-like [Camellia sinensis]|nr:CBS domain-containing protein CBSX3, mitochondrial-like [Camellia sinensis]